MNKIIAILVASAEILLWITSTSSIAGSGLNLIVVDEKSKGVESQIYAEKDAAELKIGTTDHNGNFTDRNYQCGSDRNLVAKPIDKTYFNSPLEPCVSPQRLLVVSRLTPKGNLAFGGFSRSFLTQGGVVGQVTYKATLETVEFPNFGTGLAKVDPETLEILKDSIPVLFKTKCVFDYKIDVNKSKFVLTGDKWHEIRFVNGPAKEVVPLTDDEIKRYINNKEGLTGKDNNVLTTSNGFILVTKSTCGEARETANNLGEFIKRAYVDKIDSGQYDKNDVDQFINMGGK